MRNRVLIFSLMSLFALSPVMEASARVLQQTPAPRSEQLHFPQPTGPFGVGKRSQLFTDPSRPETFTDDPADVRQLPVTFYYPSRTLKSPQPWLQGKTLEALAQSSGLPLAVLSQLQGYSQDGTPMAPGRFPLVILSHGMASTPFVNTTLAEELASQGFVVAAVTHPYSALFAVLGDQVVFRTDGADLYPDPTLTDPVEQFLDRQQQYERVQEVWIKDLRFLIQKLPVASAVRNHVDARSIAVVGHSFGGVAALRVASEVQAAINMDGGFGGGPLQDTLSHTPTLTTVSESTPREPEAIPPEMEPVRAQLENMRIGRWLRISQSPGYAAYLEFKGANHNSFTDLAVLNALIPPLAKHPAYATGSADPLRTTATLNRAVLAFLKSALKGQQPDLKSLNLEGVEVVEHLPQK
ncbi:alpha/beta hydrolase family protein [Deinococcus cellulosilyticus]|uniref:Alpha/beta hydrolase n=1 Tax=Deinococcus cellulosilyticus (strain DSM 18568 / NBRC 106333 / KACC 11606 / 5516J-15) TaxID=1223518 RepID=A0A511N928_DEIC1|nr:alpha/beta fold hydrolase [Deinococcus cellulosilyticus]GEM49332.1 alpha/beta hydrolase [Deinococcus cellulosilyticus NBRC 106333 = KACC 11606]